MHSTLKLRDSDPHEDFAIAPDMVPAAWADKVLADITRDTNISPDGKNPASDQQALSAFDVAAVAPSVDTTFRATAADDIDAPAEQRPTSRWVKSAVMLVFAICSAAAAAVWQHHGDAAKQMISNWVPAFALTSSPPTETAAPAEQAETPAAQASAAEQTSAPSAAPGQPPENAAPAAADTTQLQSMAHDLAAMAQQVEQLKASIAELKAGRDVAKTSEVRPAEIKPAAPNPRPRTAAPPPPRTAAAPLPHRPMPAYPPAQTYPPAQAAAPAPLPQSAYPPVSTPSAPPPPQTAARADDDGPIVRPPMPLR